MQKFRAYSSYAEAFKDYASLMQGNKRYAAVLKQTDSAGFAHGLQRAGYATDPQYGQKLTQILNSARMRQTIMA
jgi:flagellar protein FlgJ